MWKTDPAQSNASAAHPAPSARCTRAGSHTEERTGREMGGAIGEADLLEQCEDRSRNSAELTPTGGVPASTFRVRHGAFIVGADSGERVSAFAWASSSPR